MKVFAKGLQPKQQKRLEQLEKQLNVGTLSVEEQQELDTLVSTNQSLLQAEGNDEAGTSNVSKTATVTLIGMQAGTNPNEIKLIVDEASSALLGKRKTDAFGNRINDGENIRAITVGAIGLCDRMLVKHSIGAAHYFNKYFFGKGKTLTVVIGITQAEAGKNYVDRRDNSTKAFRENHNRYTLNEFEIPAEIEAVLEANGTLDIEKSFAGAREYSAPKATPIVATTGNDELAAMRATIARLEANLAAKAIAGQ